MSNLLRLQMKTNASVPIFVVEHLVTTLWGAINACALLDISLNSSVEVAKMSMSVALHKPHAATVAQTQKVVMSVDAHLGISE